ncbi:sigma-70 family RNA polymerase sigma factor [Micromonospora echinospora]|uniref:sigma-70 family RNA polymerase sigma factor n=1 Tax=Micromonospora echinospora TaxID=1877 RepID=UPI003A8C0EDF
MVDEQWGSRMDTAAQDDRTLVEAVRRGERAGLEGLYRRYADRLYTYARVLVREPEAAADAVHDAFLTASQRIDQLRDPDRLRPWLYAIVRNECLRQIRDRSRAAPLDEAAEPVADTADPGTDVNIAQVRDLVHTAAAALNPGDREVVHLAIRHDLSSADIGAALGVPANHAHARLSRARTQLERALGALLVARSGARDCPALAETIDGWQGTLTPTLRKRVARHIDNCASCGLLRREQLNPAALLSAYTAPGFLVVADTVWPRLAGAGPADGQAADATDDGVTDGDAADGGPADGGVTGAADGQGTDTTGGVTDPTGGSADVGSSPGATTAPPATTGPSGPSGPAEGTPPPGPAAGRDDAPAAEPRNGPTGEAGDRAAAGSAADAAPRSAATVAGGVAPPRPAAHPARVTSASTHDRRRRRRLAATAGLLVLLALAGTWALAPGRRAEQVAATSGATTGRSATATTAAAVPAATTPAVTATASGTAAPTAPGPGATGTAAVPPAPGSRPGAAAPTTAPGTTVAPTTAPAVARPTTSSPPRRAFTVSASAHVRCGQDTYSLVVRATGSAAVGQAEVRWTPVGGTTSTQAMTVDGASAQATVGRLRATALTWSVRMTSVDGRTAQSPTYQVTDPCVRPG